MKCQINFSLIISRGGGPEVIWFRPNPVNCDGIHTAVNHSHLKSGRDSWHSVAVKKPECHGNTKHWNHPKTYGISQKCPKWAKISRNEPKIYWNDPKSSKFSEMTQSLTSEHFIRTGGYSYWTEQLNGTSLLTKRIILNAKTLRKSGDQSISSAVKIDNCFSELGPNNNNNKARICPSRKAEVNSIKTVKTKYGVLHVKTANRVVHCR